MGRLTIATAEQKEAVASMIDVMLKPNRGPLGSTWCQSWDVVCSYSEKHINELLRKRHASNSGRVLKNVQIQAEVEDTTTQEMVSDTYDLSFGPPLLKFDVGGTSVPTCSLKMRILGGKRTVGSGVAMPIHEKLKSCSLQLNGIPLGSVRGDIKDGVISSSEGEAKINEGGKIVHFDTASDEKRHVVLDFPIVRESLVVTVESDDPSVAAKSAFNKTVFQDRFKAFFTDPANCTALSYSIASINNISAPVGLTDLEPVSFQFASFAKRQQDGSVSSTSLSIFIQVLGGSKSGVVNDLQSSWQTLWSENNIQPIPTGFTASLILSASLVSKLLIIRGLEKGNAWKATDRTSETTPGIEFEARNQGFFSANTVTQKYHGLTGESEFEMYGFSNSLNDWPMRLKLYQESGAGKPRVDVNWEIEQEVKWRDGGKKVIWGEGTKRLLYSLDNNSRGSYRQVPCTAIMNDTAFSLDISVDSHDLWRCSELSEDEMFLAIQDETAEEAVNKQIKDLNPKCTISALGLGFLRTTNLLTPDGEVIDFNEGIGLKCPKDFILVGDILST